MATVLSASVTDKDGLLLESTALPPLTMTRPSGSTVRFDQMRSGGRPPVCVNTGVGPLISMTHAEPSDPRIRQRSWANMIAGSPKSKFTGACPTTLTWPFPEGSIA